MGVSTMTVVKIPFADLKRSFISQASVFIFALSVLPFSDLTWGTKYRVKMLSSIAADNMNIEAWYDRWIASQIPAPPPAPIAPRLPAWYPPPARPFLFYSTGFAFF